jgi:hypothetical protein
MAFPKSRLRGTLSVRFQRAVQHRRYRPSGQISVQQIVQELGCWLDAGHQEMIAGAGARHVKQVPFAVINIFEIGIVRDILDALLRGNDLVVARHDGDGTEFQPLREMHRSDRDLALCDLNPVAEFDGWKTGLFDDVPRPAKLAGRADEHADLVRLHSLFDPACDPPTT